METYFRLKTIFTYYIPGIIIIGLILLFVGILIYSELHYILIDKRKYKLLEANGYKHEVRDVASFGNKVWYHWIKREPNWSSLKDEDLDKMKYKDLKKWIDNEVDI